MHRDVKPGNVLISAEGVCKFIDFGIARKFSPEDIQFTKGVVTRYYKPPEIVYGARNYGTSVDMWSVGCVLGEMLKRAPLFKGSTDIEQLACIFSVTGSATEENWEGVSELPNFLEFTCEKMTPFKELFASSPPSCVDLLEKILQLDPKKNVQDAMQAFYKKAKKLRKGEVHVLTRQGETDGLLDETVNPPSSTVMGN